MPTYFFDTNDGNNLVQDEEGIEVPHREAARREALAALSDMAKDHLPDGDHREFSVSVRQADGSVIYRAALTLSGGWAD